MGGLSAIVFHRYSEPLRRVIFFARQEASRVGGATISTEHLLMGLLWENSWLIEPLLAPGHTVEALKRKIETVASSREKLPTSVEMRLAEPAKAALSYAEEEATRLLSSTVDVSHLLLGLLRTHDSKAANLLAEFGLKVDDIRLKVVQGTLSTGVPFGAVVCAFYGIEIRFDVAAEAVPKLIAKYRGHMALIEIDPVTVIRGNLPPRAESMILEWVALRKDEISVAWKAGKDGKRPPPISPLE